MKNKIIIAGIALITLLFAAAFGLSHNLSYMRDIELHSIDLTIIEDGSHTGTFERGRFTNTLTVHVEGGRIIGIDIDNDVWGAWVTNISDEVFSRVIDAQGLEIDAIAGATVTMNAYLSAIKNALLRAVE